MKGHIYIASAFLSLKSKSCVIDNEVDNDPHVWNKPYTWGICRPDLRERVTIGDYIFFVFGANAKLPQMIFAYIKVDEIISHCEAYFRKELILKRMTNNKFNGNIIVDYYGDYNKYDKRIHFDNFERIKKNYVVADMSYSKLLSIDLIKKKAPDFVNILSEVFNKKGKRPIDFISRAGQELDAQQMIKIIKWLKL